MANQLKTRYDIIINGGGIVGFTLLNLIQKSPHLNRFKVLLIEQATKPTSLKQSERLLGKSSNSVSDLANFDSTDADPVFSNRVSSITLKSRRILDKLGAWSSLKPYAKDVKSIKVWNYNYANKITFNQLEQATDLQDVMFSVVENNRLSLSLLDNICKINDEVIRWDNNLTNLQRSTSDGTIEITTKDKSDNEFIASAPLILGCDGFKSKVRDFASFNYNELNLDKTAVVGTVQVETDFMAGDSQTNDVAFQRFSPERDTIVALLPLDNKYSSFVISAPSDYAKHLISSDENSFLDEFNQLLSRDESPGNVLSEKLHDISRLASSTIEAYLNRSSYAQSRESEMNFGPENDAPRVTSLLKNSRASFPLIFGTTIPRMIASLPGKKDAQIALLGDSTHRVHPLAGQGLNLGIQDAHELVHQLEAIAKCGERLFDDRDQSLLAKALTRYEMNRQSYIIPMSIGILSMPYLFKLAPPSLISTFDRLTPLKKASVRFANGL